LIEERNKWKSFTLQAAVEVESPILKQSPKETKIIKVNKKLREGRNSKR
jgi:hypothetical protein